MTFFFALHLILRLYFDVVDTRIRTRPSNVVNTRFFFFFLVFFVIFLEAHPYFSSPCSISRKITNNHSGSELSMDRNRNLFRQEYIELREAKYAKNHFQQNRYSVFESRVMGKESISTKILQSHGNSQVV